MRYTTTTTTTTTTIILIISFQISFNLSFGQEWIQVESLPESFNETHHSFAFSLENLGYIVSGSSNLGVHDDFYQYDPIADNWIELDPFPGSARGFAIGDTWNGKAYFGFGYDGNTYLNDLWVFDSSNMNWSELASCPCDPRAHPALIAHNNKVYVGMGNGTDGNMNDWWVYDIASNSWSQKDNLPSEPRHHPYQFGIGNYVYTGFGHGNGIFNNWFRFDTLNETWEEVASLPAEGRVAGTQFSYNGIGYVLSGDGEDHNSMETGEFWAYDPNLNSWEELLAHPGSSRWAPGSFVIEGEVYLINGTSFNQYVSEIYKFDLNSSFSIGDPTSLNIIVYPNPVSEIINIKGLENQEFKSNIYNLNGVLIESYLNKSTINVENLPNGFYFLEIIDSLKNKKEVKKLMKAN